MHDDSASSDDDIDRKSLRALRERFLGLNRARLDALRARLSEERRAFVDAVPLLLHSNHAALPGFVDFDTPCGIERYTPDHRALNAVRKMALSFVLERFVERRTQIQAVYVTQLPGDALELSVCSTVATHAALTEKLSRLARYAADRGITLTTTLLDPAEELAGRSRLRTPRLARDAFYRSAILLAGRYPIWWLVPPQLDLAHDAYSARLKSQRFIGRDETIDLGRAEPIPRSECLAAGIELLDAALAAPYTHLPSLMLLESYAGDPAVEPLAHFYKERIWRGDVDVDSSTLLNEAIETYFAAGGEADRLELARDCRRGTLREPTLAELQRENARVNAELQRTHGNLARLATELHASTDMQTRLDAMGTRIALWTARRDDAIPRINPALWPKRVAGQVRIEAHARQWRLNDGETTLFHAPRFAAAIAWAHTHRLGIDNLRVGDAQRHACARMLELLSRYDGAAAAQASTLLIVNAEESPQFALRAPGEAIVSEWDDPLDFSGFHTSLVAGVDRLDLRPDGITATGRAGDDGLIDMLVDLLSQPPATLHVRCAGGEHERALENRIAQLTATLSASFHRNGIGRFAFGLAGGFVVVERSSSRFATRRCANEAELFEALATADRGALQVDARNARLGALNHLCDIASPEHDVVLVHELRGHISVLLALRDGAIHRFVAPYRPAHEVASDLEQFLARDAGLRIEIHIAKAAEAPRRIASGSPKRGDARAATRRNPVALLREKFASETQSTRHSSIA